MFNSPLVTKTHKLRQDMNREKGTGGMLTTGQFHVDLGPGKNMVKSNYSKVFFIFKIT